MSRLDRNGALAVCRLLADTANGRTPDTTLLPDEDALLRFCKAHHLITIVSSALRTAGIPEEPYHTLHTIADTAAFHQVKNDLTTAALSKQLTTNGIDIVPLKGSALQAVYPEGWIRTATDADFYIPPHQLDRACAELTAAGFVQSGAHDGDTAFQKPPRTVIELHTTLGGFTPQQQQTLEQLSHTPFSVNEHYVYTLFHLYKHFLYAGAGVRMFFDVYCLSRAVTDRALIDRWLDKLALRGFDRAVQTVNGILFDGDSCPDPMTEVIDLILTSGAFGTSDTYHAMKRANQPITHTRRTRAWLTDYGFDRNTMTNRYPVLKQHRWLYPACAAHRVIHGLMFKRHLLKQAVRTEHAVAPEQMSRVLRAMQIL